jgi:hypothetical protein
MHHVFRAALAVMGTVLALMLFAGLPAISVPRTDASMPVAGRGPLLFPPGSAELYRLTAAQNVLQPMSMQTLQDMRAGLLRLAGGHPGSSQPGIAVTADGSKVVTMIETLHHHYPIRTGDQMLQVLDARTGAALSVPQHPAIPLVLLGVSADGSTVYGFRADAGNSQPCASTGFYFLDVRTGRVTHHVTIDRWTAQILIDPHFQRLYTLVGSDQLPGCDPSWSYAPTVKEYDIRTGLVVHSRRFPGLLAGDWLTHRTVSNERVMAVWQPGFALSPDGTQLAVLDGHDDTLTIMDPGSLRIVGSEKVASPQTPLQRIAEALGVSPAAAQAKGQTNGVSLQMQYTADGHSLVVTGSRYSPDPRSLHGQAHALGIRLIDVRTGMIKAWLHETSRLIGLWPAPDGSGIYSTIQRWTRRSGWSTTLRRHDPYKLHVDATRTFRDTGNWWVSIYFLQAHH